MGLENNNMPGLEPLFNAIGYGLTAMEHAENGLSRWIRKLSDHSAANIAERHVKLPELDKITAFHMPTVRSRKSSDPSRFTGMEGGAGFADRLYDHSRIFAAYHSEAGEWTVTRQRFKVYESEMKAGIDHNAGRLESFTCPDGYDALKKAEELFEAEYYVSSAPDTPFSQRPSTQITEDTYPENFLMHYLARRIAFRNQPAPAATPS